MRYLLIALITTLTLSATPLAKTFSNGSVDGEVKLFYYDIKKDTSDDAYASSLGGFLKYSTDTNNSFFGSIRFDTSNPIGNNKNKIKTNLFNNDNNADALSVNSEAFVAYKTNDRIIRLGNVTLNTPLMNNDTTRIVPWSYQGFTYAGKVTNTIKVQLNYISKIRSFTSPTYKKQSASGEIGDDGITMLSFHYDNHETLNLQTYYYYAPELYSTFVFQADHQYSTTDTTLFCLGMQYYKSGNGGKYADTLGKNGGDDINLIALRVMLDSDDWMASINYSQNFGISGVSKGYGGLAKVYTTSMIANGRANYKPETWMLKTSYYLPFSSHNDEVALNLTNTKVADSRGDGFDALYLHFKHYFSADASLYFRYEKINYSTLKSDANFFRTIAQYRF